jgi:hypothetical protein
LIEQGRATLVDDQGRSSGDETASTAVESAPDTKPVASTPRKSKATLEAEIAADSAALSAAESEGLAAPAESE